MRLSDVDKAVKALTDIQKNRESIPPAYRPDYNGVEHALSIVLKVRDKLRIRKGKR